MSALGDEIKALIGQEGPISVERYMALALGHPTLRLLHESRSLRRRGRFHDRAGNQPDVRRTGRAVGGRSLGDDGQSNRRCA